MKRNCMNDHEICPDCGKVIFAISKRCACGWIKAEEQKQVDIDHYCQYQLQGMRCKLHGSISPSTQANKKWYCFDHYYSLGNPVKSEEWFHYVEKHYEEILKEREDWHRELHQRHLSTIFRSATNG